MPDRKNIMVPPQGGMIRDVVLRVRLVLRLLRDRRVNTWLKLIPIGGVIYLISPIDLIPEIALPVIGVLDDAAILWLTNHLFIELCPPDVVQEHVRALAAGTNSAPANDVVDADSVEIKNQGM
jgi:uncharacterized membrane protein YkvA (DUF1232 family)